MFVVHERLVELHDHARASHVTLDETRHRERGERVIVPRAGSVSGTTTRAFRVYECSLAITRVDATGHRAINIRVESNCSCP